MTVLKNAKILDSDFHFVDGAVQFQETIEALGSSLSGGNERDLSGCYLIPGLVDIHTHGAVGVDAMDLDLDFEKWKNYLLANGVTTFFPTTVTASFEEIQQALERLKQADGVNMEGPFLSIGKKGAHDASKIREVDLGFMREICDKIAITTVAPEVGGNLQKIHDVTEMGVRVSLGHTSADYALSCEAFHYGATEITHTFNAMNPLHHREPGLIGAAAERDSVFCEVISDGVHLHPSVVRMLYHMLGADRMVLISDSMAATGFVDGIYHLGGLDVIVKNKKAHLEDGTIAGSTNHLMQMVRCAVEFGIPLADAVKMASLTPARAVGISASVGSIETGKSANLVVLDKNLQVKEVYYHGRLLSQR